MKLIAFEIILLSACLGAVPATSFVVLSQSAIIGRKAVIIDTTTFPTVSRRISSSALYIKLSEKRKKELGVGDDEDEYDLGKALDTNTDPLITKIIAGSLILAIIGLLVVAVIIPLTTDYGDGVCNPILTAGRC